MDFKENFSSNYRKCVLEGNENDKSSSSKRKCLSQMFNASLKFLDPSSSCWLLENKLTDYFQSADENKIFEKRLEKNFHPPNQTEVKSNLSSINIKSLTDPLECSEKGDLSCPKSEVVGDSDFEVFLNSFGKPNKVESNEQKHRKIIKSHSSNAISIKDKEISSNRDSNSRVLESKNRSSDSNVFKTANEELQIRNLKKYGSASSNWDSSGQNLQPSGSGQKRKLGTARSIHSKFVSPLLSSANSNGGEAVPQKIEEVDERLKNIDPKMIELIKSEILDNGPLVAWDDIAGLDFAKNTIQETVVWPMLRPDIFTGLRRPPKGILLFGPPGTGKTLIGKCVASQSKSTFFSISASSLTSKWIGESEKMVRALFTIARCHQPAVIFIDEIDSLLSQRSDNEHESSRRVKTEFLVQLDGATTDSEERLLVIGATNRPQDLDEAARRRFVKRLYIPLPDFKARLQLVNKLISKEKHELSGENFENIAKNSEGYSGADMRNLCSEASLGPIRSIDINLIEKIEASQVRGLVMDDFNKALNRVKASVSSKDLDQYEIWDRTYGSGF